MFLDKIKNLLTIHAPYTVIYTFLARLIQSYTPFSRSCFASNTDNILTKCYQCYLNVMLVTLNVILVTLNVIRVTVNVIRVTLTPP